MAWYCQATDYCLAEPVLTQIYVAIWRHWIKQYVLNHFKEMNTLRASLSITLIRFLILDSTDNMPARSQGIVFITLATWEKT